MLFILPIHHEFVTGKPCVIKTSLVGKNSQIDDISRTAEMLDESHTKFLLSTSGMIWH
jgi:hypothetical protein